MDREKLTKYTVIDDQFAGHSTLASCDDRTISLEDMARYLWWAQGGNFWEFGSTIGIFTTSYPRQVAITKVAYDNESVAIHVNGNTVYRVGLINDTVFEVQGWALVLGRGWGSVLAFVRDLWWTKKNCDEFIKDWTAMTSLMLPEKAVEIALRRFHANLQR